ncbi:MAG TPA: hypothetical protein VGR71_15295 [Nitrospira sp.]|nr:hypothetical protein [Nitrospira sp.]
MSQDQEPIAGNSGEPIPAEDQRDEEKEEQDMGDFITRHVLEKDSVFFEG